MDDVNREDFDRLAAEDEERERFEFYGGDVLLLARFATLDDRCNPHSLYVSGLDRSRNFVGRPTVLSSLSSVFRMLDGVSR